MVKGGFKFLQTPLNRVLVAYGIFCYIQLWRGAFFLNSALPLDIGDPRFSNWKNYMVLFILFAVVASTIKDVKQIKIIVLLMCIAVFLVDKGFYGNMSGRDLSHFSYEVRDGGPLGYAGVNGVATFEAELMLFLLGTGGVPEENILEAGRVGPAGLQRLLPDVFVLARSLCGNHCWCAGAGR